MKSEKEMLMDLNEKLMQKVEDIQNESVERIKVKDEEMKTNVYSLESERDNWKNKAREVSEQFLEEKEKVATISARLELQNKLEKEKLDELMKSHDVLKAEVEMKENMIEEMKKRVDEISEDNDFQAESFRVQHEILMKQMAEMDPEKKRREESFEKYKEKALKREHRKYEFVRTQHYDMSGHLFDHESLKKTKIKKEKPHLKPSILRKIKRKHTPKKKRFKITTKKITSFY